MSDAAGAKREVIADPAPDKGIGHLEGPASRVTALVTAFVTFLLFPASSPDGGGNFAYLIGQTVRASGWLIPLLDHSYRIFVSVLLNNFID